ncbi:hypothetical protein SAGEFAYGE_210 [Bacillus phage SageFayge]|uniref:Uncharacterized protein n=2 Tax=Wphvirus TaxID=1922327 RepID=A0A143FLN8_9CAUD|nr:hypothetical protein SAGEFAYGE_210 [Bacillus phage SageFayge]AMW63130.1 hypothetical protein SAGEFAYGE_210 [Bacillus phage SageFayge]
MLSVKKSSFNSRSHSRGLGARGMNGLNDNGRNAMQGVLKKTSGNYRVEFIEEFKNVTERNVELKEKYALELVAKHTGTSIDIIRLVPKRNGEVVTLTCLDSVYYVKIGTTILGKVSIRVQRTFRGRSIMIVYKTKVLKESGERKAYTRNDTFVKKTKGEIAHDKRNHYRNN